MENESTIAMIKWMDQDFVRLDRFNGTNFTRWQDKLKFLLTALKIFYILNPNLAPLSEPTNGDSDAMRAEQNDLAERKNRTLVEMINAMLIYSKLPFNLWSKALLSACRILNRIPSKFTKISPYELWK